MRNLSKVLTVLAAAAALCAVSCKKEEPVDNEPKTVKVTGVTLTEPSKTVTEGDEFTLVAKVAPENATDPSVSWSSSDPAVVSIAQDGKAKALKAGSATITVTTTDGGKTATCAVTVNALVVGVESVTVTPDKADLVIGLDGTEPVELKASVLPENATDPAVTWSSDNADVAVVDETGLVYAKSAGTAVITAKAGDKTGTCTVTVEYNVPFVGKYAVKSTRIYGGTGAEYGGDVLFDPTAKAVCFNASGYGPEAYNDDYFELELSGLDSEDRFYGVCKQYGGADAKEWNCSFIAALNPVDPGFPKDATANFCQLPLGQSQWVYDAANQAIVFIDSKGVMTYGMMLAPGTYPLSSKSSKTLTVENGQFALGFACKGADDWNTIYTNYDVSVGNPHNFFYIVERVETIPDASKTTGVAVPEVIPGDYSKLNIQGSWEVTNLWVVGGAVDCVTKDKAEDKSWCWNNISKELDNILTITPTSQTAGTASYTAGADGAYWDYIFKGSMNKKEDGVDVDCTKWYGWLPHSEMNFSFDYSTFEASFTAGETSGKAKVLAPGSYVFHGKSALVIGDNQMGLRYVISTKFASDKTWAWTDYDRFVNGPLVYIMVFDKK